MRAVPIFASCHAYVWWSTAQLPDRSSVNYSVVWFVAFEFLIYQSRYVANDIIGRRADVRDPCRIGGSRLPERVSNSWLWVWVTVRGGAGVVLMLALPAPGDSSSRNLILIALAFSVTVHETIRANCDRGLVRPRFRVPMTIALAVGTGYGARAALGLLVAYHSVATEPPAGSVPLAFAYLCLIGVVGPLVVWNGSAKSWKAAGGHRSDLRVFIQPFDLRSCRAERTLIALTLGLSCGVAFWCGQMMVGSGWVTGAALGLMVSLASAISISRGPSMVAWGFVALIEAIGSAAFGEPSALPIVASLIPYLIAIACVQYNHDKFSALLARGDWFRSG